MMKKLKNKIYIFAFISFGILFTRCQTEEIQSINENIATTTNAEKWFKNNNLNLEVLKYTKNVNWDNAIIINTDGRKAVEVPIILINNTSTNVTEDKDYKTNMRLLFIEDKDEVYKVFNINYTTKNADFDNNNKQFNLYETGSEYSGYITIQNSKNKVVYSGKYENGIQSSLHKYDEGENKTKRMVCSYYVTVGNITNCSSWTWYPDYGPGDLPYGYMPGISGPMHIWSRNTILNLPQNSLKILNRTEYLKSFNLSKGGLLHIYVDQPIKNGSATYSGTILDPNVGHTFIALEQDGHVRVLGFYPTDGVNPFTSPSALPAYINDSAHPYDVKISFPMSSTQLSNVISNINGYSTLYNLNTNNCTDFAQQISSAGGLNLPNTNGSWPGGGGSNPGNLGQDIRNMQLPSNAVRNTTGGIALSNTP